MKRMNTLILSFLLLKGLFGQVDLLKLQQEYVARKAALDSMYAKPDVPYISFKTKNKEGIEISAWWLAQDKNKGSVLLVHGFAMNKSLMLSRAKLYYNMGYNVVVMDLRARGESGGVATTSGPEIRSDVTAVIDYYENNFKEYGPLILAGYSHGGRAIVFAAETRPESVKGIILESIPYSLSESFKRVYKVNPPPFPEGDIQKAFQAISNIPNLLLVGNMDNAIVPEEAQKIKATFENAQSQLVVFDGAGHDLSQEKYRPLYMEAIKSFMMGVMNKDKR